MREKPERAFGGQIFIINKKDKMETVDSKTKAIELMAGAMSEVGPEVTKEMVKDNLLKTIDANLQYWEEVKKALEEIS